MNLLHKTLQMQTNCELQFPDEHDQRHDLEIFLGSFHKTLMPNVCFASAPYLTSLVSILQFEVAFKILILVGFKRYFRNFHPIENWLDKKNVCISWKCKFNSWQQTTNLFSPNHKYFLTKFCVMIFFNDAVKYILRHLQGLEKVSWFQYKYLAENKK